MAEAEVEAEAEADYSPLDFGPSAIESKRESPEFLEVKCNSSGKTRRFAPGTDAGFAVSVINRKLMLLATNSKSKSKSLSLSSFPLALHIEASKENENEEPISFGPNSPLLNYGDGWILQTVVNVNHTQQQQQEKNLNSISSGPGNFDCYYHYYRTISL